MGTGEIRSLAVQLAATERPLLDDYERIARSAPAGTLRRLAEQMARAQRFQLATLELILADRVPESFVCFGRVTHDDVKVRAGPSPRAELVRTVGAGLDVIVMESSGNWLRVQLPDGVAGWVFKDYVRCELTG